MEREELIKAKKEVIEKAAKWLEDNFYNEMTDIGDYCIAYQHEDYNISIMVDDFRRAMEEEI